MKLTVIGAGYVGLVTTLGFAQKGFKVLCYDHDEKRIEQLRAKKMPIHEAGLPELLKKHGGKRVQFTTQLEDCNDFASHIFLCINITSFEKLAHLVRNLTLNHPKKLTLILKSTSPVGTHRKLRAYLDEHGLKNKIDLVSNPEFLSEGIALKNFHKPFRLVLGSESPAAIKSVEKIYASLKIKNILHMDPTSAEMTKHAANSLLATKVSFMNEMSRLCESLGADVDQLREGLSLDPRLGPYFLSAGPGYGGSCLPKEIAAMKELGKSFAQPLPLITAVEKTNAEQIDRTFQKIQNWIEDAKLKSITVWGLAYKPGTDDLRYSPSLDITLQLIKQNPGVQVKAFDPALLGHTGNLPPDISVFPLEESLQGSELLVLLTDWPEFSKVPLKKIKKLMKSPNIFDSRNQLSPTELRTAGFRAQFTGRPEL